MHDPADTSPRLLVVVHGTASAVGSRTTGRLVEAIAAARPHIPVQRCFLDVASPDLPETLAQLSGPTVLVPLLLSTGYHVQTDIPAAAAEHSDVVIARHLGPHPLLVETLVERLGAGATAATIALVGTGSSRSEARGELERTGELLARRLVRPVTVHTVGKDLAAQLGALPAPLAVATYLLAEGQFLTSVRSAAGEYATVGDPLGVHPAVVELAWLRYDEALGTVR